MFENIVDLKFCEGKKIEIIGGMEEPLVHADSSEEYKKTTLLIEQGNIQLELHNRIFTTIDSKAQWFFTIIAATESYMIVTHFLTHKIQLGQTSDFVLLVVLLLGGFILGIHVHILYAKRFKTGPNICNYHQKFLNNEKTELDLKKDILLTLADSYFDNDKTLINKSKWFKRSIVMMVIYFTLIVLYFLISR